MGNTIIKIEGIEELSKKLKNNVNLDDLKKIIKTNGSELTNNMIRKAEFKKGYQTGTTKRSIILNIVDNGLTAEVGPTTKYAPYLEYGTRKSEPQPFVNPALNEQKQKFQNDLAKLVK